jgi:ketosteroid isomerase-like protein
VNDTSSMQVVLAVFAAVERRDQAAFARSCQPDAEFCWPPSLPYGRTVRGLTDRGGAGWEAYWNPLQPTAGHRRLDPRVIAATEEEVVVLWRQRGVTPAGDSIDTEVLGLYSVRAGKLARAQMFYFDPASVISFLAKAIPAGPDQATGADEPSAGARQRSRQGRRALRVQARGQVLACRTGASPQPPREVTEE